jgi:hypothetical protein
MLLEETLDKVILKPVELFVLKYLLLILVENALEHTLTNLSEGEVLVVLADGEIDVITQYEFLEHPHQNLLEAKNLLVKISLPQRLALDVETIKDLHKLKYEAG